MWGMLVFFTVGAIVIIICFQKTQKKKSDESEDVLAKYESKDFVYKSALQIES
jgi:hypothetical protein